MALVKIEGSELELDDAICKSDKTLKEALAPFYPAVTNADVKRESKGAQTVLTVTKRAGSKGAHSSVIKELDKAEEWIHPALLVEARGGWKGANPSDVDEALIEAIEDEGKMQSAATVLGRAPAEASSDLPVGF